VLQILHSALHEIFNALPPVETTTKSAYKRIAWKNRKKLRKPAKGEKTFVIDADGFEPELHDRDSKIMVGAFRLGWKHFIADNLVGQRFHGVGLGPDSTGVRIDLYDSSGDYEASSGAIYIRDPEHRTVGEQLNGGHFHPLADAGWALIKPYLLENEKLFGIKLDDLLTHNGRKLAPAKVFRKVGAMKPAEAIKSRRRREPRDDLERRREEAQEGRGVRPKQ